MLLLVAMVKKLYKKIIMKKLRRVYILFKCIYCGIHINLLLLLY
ncbi:hypothetical protein H5410_006561 [Solanum commersonii]|uniref:Uncharacterized protein n=1 Tax=Solanum commersonii TaxID=4109 RepID=A0A9J6ABQ5_SOLCO|nr:hypothetical protein H5410_006561 [Solanum commersonii]